ncbi:aldo/keto reductase [Anaerocolumna sp. MB42-C2]|uniref:aldo/keto reductase n=1 Tax=Anaerocolumna sp. MB42-C2 TaxID=3070997 RepID=UPI0027DFCAD9|nr:aldo/keto reductase [Anaerocolumna sp. MB42-C2]WMJ88668.1 aldo/keto reductase [Anaerocolumna sp. MB42-C2]
MYYKQYGNTEYQVSAIGMGCMRYDETDVKAGDFNKCAEVALYAAEKGINYFDTAPFYCDDKSEIITGMALSQLPRDSYYVSSKTNMGTVGGQGTADDYRRRLETTLSRLKVDYLDFYHLWCILNLDSFKKQCDSLYSFFEKAKADGLIRNIVFSSHMQGNDLEEAVASDLFKGMLIGYNALNYRFRQTGIEAAYQKGMGVVVMNPLGGGLIPNNPKTFSYLAEGTDLTVPQAALNFVASHKEITITLAGCTTKSHIDDACKAVENLVERPARDIYEEYENKGVALNNLCTGCAYCKHCPKEIDIPKFMDAYNEKLLGNNLHDRLKYHWQIPAEMAAECIKCGKCENLCTQHLPIMERLSEIAG